MTRHHMVKQSHGPKAWWQCSGSDECHWCWLGTYASQKPGKRQVEARADFDRIHEYLQVATDGRNRP